MTPGERALWIAVYAASWHQSGGYPVGHVTDEMRALWSAGQAMRAVNALRALAQNGDEDDHQARQARKVLE